MPFRCFAFSHGVFFVYRHSITSGEKTKQPNNEMAQTSHHNVWSTEEQTDGSIIKAILRRFAYRPQALLHVLPYFA